MNYRNYVTRRGIILCFNTIIFRRKVSYRIRLKTVAIVRLFTRYKNEIFTTALVDRDVGPYQRSVI